MKKPSLLDVLQELTTVFEERVLDDNCAKHKMKWDEYINKILDGWNPDIGNDYLLEAYRVAIKKLKRSGRIT